MQAVVRKRWVGREIRKWEKAKTEKPLYIMLCSVVKQSTLSLPSYRNIIRRNGNNSSLKIYQYKVGHFQVFRPTQSSGF